MSRDGYRTVNPIQIVLNSASICFRTSTNKANQNKQAASLCGWTHLGALSYTEHSRWMNGLNAAGNVLRPTCEMSSRRQDEEHEAPGSHRSHCVQNINNVGAFFNCTKLYNITFSRSYCIPLKHHPSFGGEEMIGDL